MRVERLLRPAFAVAVVCVAACAAGGLAGGASAASSGRAAPTSVPGWAFLAPDAPVDGGSVRLLTPGGRDLSVRAGTTGSRGTFFVYAKSALPQRFLIEVTGGFEARTPGQLRQILERALGETRFTVIEVPLAKGDISPILRGFAAAFKKRV